MSELWTPGSGGPTPPPTEPTETVVHGQDEPQIRLLACKNCQSIEVLDDYTGPLEMAERYDVILNLALEKHKDGVERRPHIGALVKVPKASWESPEAQEQIRREVIARFDPGYETGLGSEAYALRDNFRADAMKCWEQHMRTPNCSDYKDSSKLLVPDTASERKEAGLTRFDKSNPHTQRFLCEYCPVHSLVQQAARKRAGLYDN